MPKRNHSSMRKLSDETAKKVDEQLREEELALIRQTTIDWDSLRPQITDSETFENLMAIVKESTKQNESIAQFKDRVKKLGSKGIEVATRIASLLK